MLGRIVIALVSVMAISVVGGPGSIGPTLAAAQERSIDGDGGSSSGGGADNNCKPGLIPTGSYDDDFNYLGCYCTVSAGGGYCYCSGGESCQIGGGWCGVCYADASEGPEIGGLAFYRLGRRLSLGIRGAHGILERELDSVVLTSSLMGEDFGYVVGGRCLPDQGPLE